MGLRFTHETPWHSHGHTQVKNTPQGTVVGCVMGQEDSISVMKHWLATVGSKASVIEDAAFQDEKAVELPSTVNLVIKRKPKKKATPKH